MQKITPFLWFDAKAEEAAEFYVSIFKDAKILGVTRYTEAGQDVHHRPPGSAMTVEFQLEGERFTAINGGPGVFAFSGAISFVIHCKTQDEVDHHWERLSAVKEAEQCGWLKDKYGVTWQVVPDVLVELLGDKDKEKAGRVMNAMMKMKKIDIAALKQAYEQA